MLAKVRHEVNLVARANNITLEDVVLTSISPKTTPGLHQAVEGNRVHTAIAASVGGYETLSLIEINPFCRLFSDLKLLKQSEHIAPLLSKLGKGVPAQAQKTLWGVSDRAIRLARETVSIQNTTTVPPQETNNLKKPRGRGNHYNSNKTSEREQKR